MELPSKLWRSAMPTSAFNFPNAVGGTMSVLQNADDSRGGRSCYACISGMVRPTNLRGRRFDYRGVAVTFDEDVVAPVCDSCADIRMRAEIIRQVNTVLERLHEQASRSIAPAD